MFERLMIAYQMSMRFDVRSPMLHLVGPAGSGKSSTIEELARLLGVNLHIINVSRLSPLEIEGVQMPHGAGEEMVLKMLPARYWTRMQEGDIVLFDEFLRGFPEVYNALLDIFTSRKAGEFELPKVFIVGASNSVTTYDDALKDRLVHMPVADPRKSASERKTIAEILVKEIGLLPAIVKSQEMDDLIHNWVLPAFDVLDTFDGSGQKAVPTANWYSVRNLIGQAQMRYIKCPGLTDLIQVNNLLAMSDGKPQYVVLIDGRDTPVGYADMAAKLEGNPKLTDIQARNIEAGLELTALQRAKEEEVDDSV